MILISPSNLNSLWIWLFALCCQVIVRVRPCNSKEASEEATEIVEKISENSLCIADQQFTFDHVATVEASQASSRLRTKGFLKNFSSDLVLI
jgi:hypothetical protein